MGKRQYTFISGFQPYSGFDLFGVWFLDKTLIFMSTYMYMLNFGIWVSDDVYGFYTGDIYS